MQQNIKDIAELDKLLSESTSQTVMKADLAKYKRMADILNSKTNIPKEFAKMLKSKIMMLKHPRSQMMLFEIIEYMVSNALRDVVRARALAKQTLRVVRQNFAWAAAYNAACVPLALLGWLPPWAAGLGMASSSLFVVLNSLRLAR